MDRLPKDPWGQVYQYLSPGVHGDFDVFTYGADGAPGGSGADADIGSMERAITRRDLQAADPAPHMPGQAGVTLIELVIVVAVMASLAAGVSLMAGRSVGREDGDLSRFVRSYEQNRKPCGAGAADPRPVS